MGVQERRERELKRRERAILRAALELFTSDDWQAATIEQIAQRAEIGKGTVYKHFASKDEIYARLAIDFQTHVLARMRAVDPAVGVLARLRELIRVIWEAHRAMGSEHQRVVQYYEREEFWRNLSDATRERMLRLRADFEQLVGGIVQEGIEQGLFPRKPVRLLIYGAQAALRGAIHVFHACPGQQLDATQFREEITRFILAGMMHQDDPRLVGAPASVEGSPQG